MKHVVCLALCGIIMQATLTLAGAQEPFTPVMRMGDWVEIGGAPPVVVVFQAEKRLKAAGFDPGPIDGIQDIRTQEALRQYQTQKGLPVTGKLDHASRQALEIK